MKRTSLAVLMIALAILALAAPMAYAQAPAPKVTINGLIDNLTSYSNNTANYNGGILNRKDSLWYARTRGRFDFIGEVGKAKGVLGIELDHVYGQAGSNDSTINNSGPGTGVTTVQTGLATDGSFDLNTDSRGIIEIKWLYVEFPMPLVPVPTTVRLGAQPFGAAATYKVAAYAASDFPGVNVVSQITPNLKLLGTYVQVEENLTGTGSKNGFSGAGVPATQNRGDDFSYILSAEITPFKGLDIKPMFSMFYAQGTTSGSARTGRGGINTSTAYSNGAGSCNPLVGSPVVAGSTATVGTNCSRGGINEYRYTVGVDARLRTGPFSFDPTVLYQFGNKAVVAPGAAVCPASGLDFTCSGSVPGRIYHPDLNAWFIDFREGFQLGPLLLEALQVYTTGNSRRNNTLGTVRYYQPLTTDASYLGDWGTNLTSLGVDYLNAYNEVGTTVPYLATAIGYDKYGRAQVGVKATYAITPALSVSANADALWTAEKVDRDGIPGSGAGITPRFAGTPNRSSSRYLGTELNALISWRFADGLVWDNQFGYLFTGPAFDAQTDPTFARNSKDPFMLTSRVRFTF